MRFTNKFPYTTLNDINLDWIIKRVKELGETVLGFAQDIITAQTTANEALTAAGNAQESADVNAADIEDLQSLVDRKAGILIDSVSGAVATFVPDATITNLLDVTIEIGAAQAGSGTPAPSNVRPVSTRNTVQINVSGGDLTNSYTVSLGRAIYGGILDLASGVLTINTALKKLSEFPNWTYNNSLSSFNTANTVQLTHFFVTACDSYSVVDWTIPAADRPNYSINTGAAGLAQRKIYVKDSDFTNVEDFLAARGNVEIVYTVDSPIEVQLDPVTIAAIVGESNNVSSDAGNVTVKFAADLKWYIDSQIAEVQALALENGG